MMIASENQLLSIDESCLSDLSAENESTISGGCFSLFGIFSWLFGSQQTSNPGTTVVVNNYITNTNTNSSGSQSGATSGSGSSSGSGH